ncbi:hypothetical protein [Chondrinema litorale]|uniref:hypothetical protein n=1 Tax=Chondrinema litorale TaxID=2994555 RepID=UPI0025432CEE|nr:hypothetical protein [Chondrinema litorale]UZS00235.1 hypothetical protein OQ292_40460 [Chondrinema litorale]
MEKEIKKFKKQLKHWSLKSSDVKVIKDYLKYASLSLILDIHEGYSLRNKEKIIIESFRRSEKWGWDIKDTDAILQKWEELGEIIKMDNVRVKLNTLSDAQSIEEKIDKLQLLKKTKKINHEIIEAKEFYSNMRDLMDNTIDDVILQLSKNQLIDEMLKVFVINIRKFGSLETDEMSFGDTEDIETVGDFFSDIMEIIGMKYSRGVLSEELEMY